MSRCQRECHRFEPDILLHITASGSVRIASPGGFLLCPSSPIGMRRLSQKENRVGSSPTLGTNYCSYNLMVECLFGMEAMKVRFFLRAPLTHTLKCSTIDHLAIVQWIVHRASTSRMWVRFLLAGPINIQRALVKWIS